MQVRNVSYEPPSERLLLVELESRPDFATDYRHVVAYVVRRAVAHVKDPENESKVLTWWDDRTATGYRMASWHDSRKPEGAIYVDGLQLRGQIDAYVPSGQQPLAKGRPYGNSVRFTAHSIEADNAQAMHKTFQRLRRRAIGPYPNGWNRDDFLGQLQALAHSLKIKNCVFRLEGARQESLAHSNNFYEVPVANCEQALDGILSPFYKD